MNLHTIQFTAEEAHALIDAVTDKDGMVEVVWTDKDLRAMAGRLLETLPYGDSPLNDAMNKIQAVIS